MKKFLFLLLLPVRAFGSLKKGKTCFPFEKQVESCDGLHWKKEGNSWKSGAVSLFIKKMNANDNLSHLMKLIKVKLNFENKKISDHVTFNPNVKLIRVNSLSNEWYLALIKKGNDIFQVQCHGSGQKGLQQSCENLFE